MVHLIVDRHAHNKADVSLHRAVSIRGCPVSLDRPPADETKADDVESSCQTGSICQLDCNDKEFCSKEAAKDNCCSETDGKVCPAIPSVAAPLPSPKSDRYGTFQADALPEIKSQHDSLR